MSDWRDLHGYYTSNKPCVVCGSTDRIGDEPRFGYSVCEEHSHMPPCKPPRSDTINRIEVIDGEGRQFVKYLDNDSIVDLHYQDGGKTLKIFLKEKT